MAKVSADIEGDVIVHGSSPRGGAERGSNMASDRYSSLAKDILTRQSRLQDQRAYEDKLWTLVDEIATARRAKFDIGYIRGVPDDQIAGQTVYDGTTGASIREFADGWQARTANALIDWFQPMYRSKMARNDYSAKLWLDEVKEILTIEMANSNFYEELNTAFLDGISHGAATMSGPEWHVGKNKFVTMEHHPREVFLMEDYSGEINGWHIKYQLTARQILAEWPHALDEKTRKQFEGNPYKRHVIVHAIFPRKERDIKSPLRVDKPYASVYVLESKKIILDEGGYDPMELPDTWRWGPSGVGPYPTSMVLDAMAEVEGINSAMKSFLYAGQLAIRPPRIVSETLMGQVRVQPDGETYIKSPSDVIKPLEFPSQFQIGMAAITDMRRELGEKLKSRVFSIQSQMGGKVTAFQANLIQGEATASAIPITTRATSQLLIPKVNKFFHAAVRAGRIPPPPPELAEYSSTPVDIEMIGPMAMAAKRFLSQQGLTAFLALSEEINKVWPEVGQQIMEAVNADEVRKDVSESSGVPSKYFLSDEQLMALRKQKAQMIAAQQKQKALENLASAYKNASGAAEPGSPAKELMGNE